MNAFPAKALRMLTLALLCLIQSPSVAAADSSDWAEVLASRFSGNWKKILREQVSLHAELSHLPEIPQVDYGGPRGYRSDNKAGPHHPYADDQWLLIRWKQTEVVDLVSLVPARLFDEHGIDPNFDLPEDFRVMLVDEQNQIVKIIAEERNTRSDPVRKGHPFCYHVNPPLACSGIRVEAQRMYVDPARPDKPHFMAWAEIFCFQGERNVARGARIVCKNKFLSPWPWYPRYVIDEITGLGLPEIPDESHLEIGWLSSGDKTRQIPPWVQVDLGSVRSCDGIRLFPPERPNDLLIPGLYYPTRFVIEVSDTGNTGSYQTVFSKEAEDFDNPGHHAVTFHWPEVNTRFVRFRSLVLRTVATNYPPFLGFSELQILHRGENIALHCHVDASECADPIIAYDNLIWSAQSLTDGYTSRGKILSNRQWMESLHRRYEVECAIRQLDFQAAAILANYRRKATVVGGMLGCFMLVSLVVLPIRHRLLETRKLRALRAQIAADLHDEIGSSMGSIQLLTEAALSKPGLATERLTTIRLLSKASVAALRDIVWLLRPGSAYQSPALAHLRETASILLDGFKWHFESDETSREWRLSRDANRHLLLFFREALHNCVRHSKCQSIGIRISLRNRIFSMEVSDDGCGISEAQLALPYCLRSLKERAKHLGGTLKIVSAQAQGTTILLQFPVTHSNSAKPS